MRGSCSILLITWLAACTQCTQGEVDPGRTGDRLHSGDDLSGGDSSGGGDSAPVVLTGLCAVANAGEIAMQAASRASGVAPLAVHFSAVGAGSMVVQPTSDFDELHYLWSFGDAGSGPWPTDGQTRDCATGFVAGHVFTTPGTYTVRLNVTDGTNVHFYTQTIEVLDPATEAGWTTLHVANGGSDDGLGTEGDPLETFAEAMSRLAPNVRVLFNRGDTWQAGETWIDTDGPGIIGAYGSGARPAIEFTSDDGFRFGWASDNRGWRFVGLRLQGTGSGSAMFVEGANLNEMLVWDSEIESWGSGIVLSASCGQLDQNVVAASTVRNTSNWTVYMGGTRSFVQGNHLDKQNTAQSHTYRNWCADGLSLTHNIFSPALHHCVKLHSPTYAAGQPYSRNIVITDNQLQGSVWTVGLGPQDHLYDERVENVRYERNIHLRDSATQATIMVWAVDVTIRNNVFINNTGGEFTPIYIEQRGAEPTPRDVRLLHNTFFAEQGTITPVSIAAVASDTDVRNNLLAPASNFTLDGAGTGLVQSNNVATAAPGFANAGARELALTPGAPAVGAGTDVGVLLDIVGTQRDTSPDAGAYELVE